MWVCVYVCGMCVCAYVHVGVYVYEHVGVYMHVSAFSFVCYMCMWVFTVKMCMCVHVGLAVYVCMERLCAYGCVYMYLCM